MTEDSRAPSNFIRKHRRKQGKVVKCLSRNRVSTLVRLYLLLPDFTSWFTIRFRNEKSVWFFQCFYVSHNSLIYFSDWFAFTSLCTSRTSLPFSQACLTIAKRFKGKKRRRKENKWIVNLQPNCEKAAGNGFNSARTLPLLAANKEKYYSRLSASDVREGDAMRWLQRASLKFKSRRHTHDLPSTANRQFKRKTEKNSKTGTTL